MSGPGGRGAAWRMAAALVCAVTAAACGGNGTDGGGRRDGDMEIMRLERVIMDCDEASLPEALQRFDEELASPLLTLRPQEQEFMEMVRQYRTDSVMRDIDATVQRRYGDLGWLERALTEAVQRASKLDKGIGLRKAATFIGSSGYADRVRADRESATLVIAIDQYAVGGMERYGFFGDPMYVVRLSDSAYLTADCMAALAHEYIAMPPEPWSLLDYMVAEGKELFFLDQTLPRTADSIKIRYTRQQMEWAERHEAKVWAYLLHNKLLFNTDVTAFHNLIDEAPKTNAFGNESAPRAVEYVGWQMVRQYMKRSGASLHELMEETDARKILEGSGYRP
ncbi:MAG: hypothetical protein AUK63_274 [bacterium P3]|nr:MAG: hypothetical protein AUK63_274 [bacterium P3]KWW42765.1 MAG: hypothetical protein F083_169 [bacterium F083]